ncbi:MAG TPA: hypothetical protein VK986_18545 [Tepidisphaeraceae bacterium]|nr:hypothetical protein [Tepidisphaeraceae bacterium]
MTSHDPTPDARRRPDKRRLRASLRVVAIAGLVGGCGGPNAANIELRKQNQELRDQLETVNRQREADAATIRALETRPASSTTATLPHNQLQALFTAHSIELGRLTGGWDEDPKKPGDEGIKVQLTPLDDEGQKLKAAGAITVDLFDLALGENNRIGHWELSAEQARPKWLGAALQYNYLLKLPWQSPPTHAELTVKVTFTDSLTGRVLAAQQVITVGLPK